MLDARTTPANTDGYILILIERLCTLDACYSLPNCGTSVIRFALHDRIYILYMLSTTPKFDGGGVDDDDAPTIIQSRINHILITYRFFSFLLSFWAQLHTYNNVGERASHSASSEPVKVRHKRAIRNSFLVSEKSKRRRWTGEHQHEMVLFIGMWWVCERA